jgi:hypothetical protein
VAPGLQCALMMGIEGGRARKALKRPVAARGMQSRGGKPEVRGRRGS